MKPAKSCPQKLNRTILPFNKKNARVFAKTLYSETKGKIIYTPLCDGNLTLQEA